MGFRLPNIGNLETQEDVMYTTMIESWSSALVILLLYLTIVMWHL